MTVRLAHHWQWVLRKTGLKALSLLCDRTRHAGSPLQHLRSIELIRFARAQTASNASRRREWQ